MLKQITRTTLADLHQQAAASLRLRTNLNFHSAPEAAVQRLAIAMQPGTYVRAHRHSHSWELLTALHGRFVVLIYDEAGQVTQKIMLGEETRVLEMPMNCWHSVQSLDDGGVIFEVKEGAYQPVTEKDYLPGSAPEGSAEVARILNWYAQADVGDRYPV